MARKRRSLWFVNGEPCPKCGNVHDPTRCSGHRKSDGQPCQNRHRPGAVSCTRVHGGGTKAAIAAANGRVTEQEIRGFLAKRGQPAHADHLAALERQLAWQSMFVEALRQEVSALPRKKLLSDGNPIVKLRAREEHALLAIIDMCNKAGVRQDRIEWMRAVGGSVALAMKALLAYVSGALAEQKADEALIYQLEAIGPELMTRALQTLDPSQQLPGGN